MTGRVGTFAPKNMATLRSEMRGLIGKQFTFSYAGIGGADEPYPQQTRWMIHRDHDAELNAEQIGRWVPEEDIRWAPET
jgi:hypothetical protein